MTSPASRLRIATRGSQQARTQAQVVARSLEAAHPGLSVELVLVDTMGDRRQDVPLHTIGGQGVFVKEVQRAVLDGRAELAVHSAKDLPSESADGLRIGAFCERRSAGDALIGRSLDDLDQGATIATGSVRRRAQLTAVRPDLDFVELRGNIQTRLGKVPDAGSIVMAIAALEVLDPRVFVPAVGQGCVAVECDASDEHTVSLLRAIDHGPTRASVETERAFLATLGSGCSLPVGAHVMEGQLHAFLADPATRRSVRRTVPAGPDSDATARDLAVSMRRELDDG